MSTARRALTAPATASEVPNNIPVGVGETKGLSTAAIEAGEREVRQTEATQAVQADPFVQDLVKLCDAKVIDSSIRATPKNQ